MLLNKWNVAVYMNYEKFKRSDRPDRFRSLTTVNDFLSVVGEKFFNDYLRIDTKRFLISENHFFIVNWNKWCHSSLWGVQEQSL
jgi:hypothetical protein